MDVGDGCADPVSGGKVERVTAVMTEFGLGAPTKIERLPLGFMNRNWRVATPDGIFVVKQVLDVAIEKVIRQHTVTAALAGRGFPVPRQATLPGGDTVLDHADGMFTVAPWVSGVFRQGVDLDLAECATLGGLLGELHHHLADVLPVVNVDTPASADPDAALDAIDGYLALIEARTDRDDFDERAHEWLRNRRDLVRAQVSRRPVDGFVGPVAWTHGDFQQLNLLWDGGRVAAVLDWDRLRVDALAAEVTRAAVLMMDNHPMGLDLHRVSAFVDGYRTIMPLTSAQLVGAAHRWWWNYLCGLWPLNRHYEDGDTSCDRFFVINSAVLSWWYQHHDEVFEAFAGSR